MEELRELQVQQEIAKAIRAAGVADAIEGLSVSSSLNKAVELCRSCRSFNDLSELHNVAGPGRAAGYIVGGWKEEFGAVLAAVGCRCCKSLQRPKPRGTGVACYSAPWRTHGQCSLVKAMLYGWRPDRKCKHRASVKSPTLQFSPLQLREARGRGQGGQHRSAGQGWEDRELGRGRVIISAFIHLGVKTQQVKKINCKDVECWALL